MLKHSHEIHLVTGTTDELTRPVPSVYLSLSCTSLCVGGRTICTWICTLQRTCAEPKVHGILRLISLTKLISREKCAHSPAFSRDRKKFSLFRAHGRDFHHFLPHNWAIDLRGTLHEINLMVANVNSNKTSAAGRDWAPSPPHAWAQCFKKKLERGDRTISTAFLITFPLCGLMLCLFNGHPCDVFLTMWSWPNNTMDAPFFSHHCLFRFFSNEWFACELKISLFILVEQKVARSLQFVPCKSWTLSAASWIHGKQAEDSITAGLIACRLTSLQSGSINVKRNHSARVFRCKTDALSPQHWTCHLTFCNFPSSVCSKVDSILLHYMRHNTHLIMLNFLPNNFHKLVFCAAFNLISTATI